MTPDPSGRRDQQPAAQAEHPARYPYGHPQLEHCEPGGRRVHLKATDQPGDSADNSAGYDADRRTPLNQRLGGNFRD